MHTFMSMTTTLMAAAEDENVLALMSEPDTRYVFHCTRRHVLPDNADSAPYELLWTIREDAARQAYRAAEDLDHVDLTSVPGPQHALWTRFRSIIADADADQRVWWGAGRWNDDELNPFFTDARGLNTFEIADRLRSAGHTVHGR